MYLITLMLNLAAGCRSLFCYLNEEPGKHSAVSFERVGCWFISRQYSWVHEEGICHSGRLFREKEEGIDTSSGGRQVLMEGNVQPEEDEQLNLFTI